MFASIYRTNGLQELALKNASLIAMMFARMRRTAPLLVLLPLAVFSFAQTSAKPAASDPRIDALLETLGKTRIPSEADISPDGKTVAWSVRTGKNYEVHLSDVSAPSPSKELTIRPSDTANCDNDAPVWSPDGQSLAYASTCTSERTGQPQIFLWSKKTGESRQLTHVAGTIDDMAWSPDGRSIGFLFVENATRSAGALAAMKPWSGVIGEDGVEVQRVAISNVGDGSFVQATPANLHVYEFNWSPDSKELSYVAANPPGENNWWVAQLYTQVIAGGQPRSILDTTKITGSLHNLQIAVPRWSPDGKQIAFVGGLMSDQGSTGGDVYLIPSTGGEPKNITPNRAASVAFLHWVSPEVLGVSEHVGGSSHITALDVNSGTDNAKLNLTLPESIGSGSLVMSISVSKHQNVAFIRSSFGNAPEVWAGSLSNLKQITHLNDSIKPLWGKTENLEWTNEGFHVQGWLLYPANYDPSKKYPLIVSVHGGPSSAVTPRWPSVGYGGVPFSALGYFVFMPNPRGSYGQGEKFTQANIKDFGYGDLRDILAGMDALEARLPIDKNREGLTGWSYGGFMTMFTVTQTTRFHAAVAGAGISNWKSYYGENSIDQWMIPFFGASVYDDPAVYAKSSAIEFIQKVKTPTLAVVGDRDGECPAPQSFEFWHALRAQGVKTQLVVYPNEGHSFRAPEHRRDVLERALNWFETQMPAN
ncbi:dipeptidyl aminopeptidase/acylaminoacyl peptidase [Edaphobacter modestus]|uniref:Dipeptidyl aminopeptidase/acylaminoacyl peptidase n=2 Tax=Edaphobacter modestus TaxID=388466 RepID=A0A4Q7YS89_9BACT|nr:dipeptidyl aminopeptidase/acylaminoacyl peptidase [Edaphobacter modestus]